MTSELPILTPEKTLISFRLASLGTRGSAHLVDVLLIFALLIALNTTAGLLSMLDTGLAQMVALVLSTALPFVYFIICEGYFNGQTVGKRAYGLRVRMADGSPITMGAAITRNLFRPADFIPAFYMVGIVVMAANPRSQRVGDFIANTIVCVEKTDANRYAVAPHSVGMHAMEPHLPALDRVTTEEYWALRQLADRYPELTPEIQARLVETVWVPFAGRHRVQTPPGVHPLYMVEATVMKVGREKGLL